MDRKLYNWTSSIDFRRKLRRKMTPAEQRLWQYLRGSQVDGFKFRRQQGIGPYVVDFYCAKVKLVVEIDGDSHFDDLGRDHDKQRGYLMSDNAITTIRFTNIDVYESIEGVIDQIKVALKRLSE
ncbi:MAG: endonuclease domain-containing protein [bacterium]